MARMSREFSLVLLGAGLLTAGYFLWPEEDPIKREAQANGQNGGNGGNARSSGSRVAFFHIIHIPGRAPGVSPAMATSSTVRGGIGRTGGVSVGG